MKLLSENEDILAEYKSETIAIPQDNDANWTEVSYILGSAGNTQPAGTGNVCKQREAGACS